MTQSPSLPELPKHIQAHINALGITNLGLWIAEYAQSCYEAGSAAAAQAAWQPIATAPKDGRLLMLLVPTTHSKWSQALSLPGRWFVGYWITYNHDEAIARCKPTHWKPLPAAPTQGAEGAAPQAMRDRTIIGLDYDGTITRDPDMWHAVMRLMQSYGHEVHIVTMRHGVESTMGHAPMEQRFLDDADGVHFTGNSETGDRDAKRPHMDAKGIEVHVWIDDNPKAVHMSAREIWGWCTQPGDPMVHSAPEISTPSPTPTAPQQANELREALKGTVAAIESMYGRKPEHVEAALANAKHALLAGLAQHQPQQGEQQ